MCRSYPYYTTHIGKNDLRSNQDPETIVRNIAEIAYNSKTDTKEVLTSSIVPQRDSLNGKNCQVNIFLKKFYMENGFVYVNHDNIKPRQHCNYDGIHLNTLSN